MRINSSKSILGHVTAETEKNTTNVTNSTTFVPPKVCECTGAPEVFTISFSICKHCWKTVPECRLDHHEVQPTKHKDSAPESDKNTKKRSLSKSKSNSNSSSSKEFVSCTSDCDDPTFDGLMIQCDK